jgi:hypothetical protein
MSPALGFRESSMRTSNFLAAASVVLTLSAASAANAAVIYDNGAPDGEDGNNGVRWIQAEDFRFARSARLTGAGVYIGGNPGIGSWDGSFQYYLFSESGGKPSSVLDSGDVAPAVTDTGVEWIYGGNIFLFEFDFGPDFLAQAGTTYFLGIHIGASNNFRFNISDPLWVTTAANGTSTGRESLNGALNNWAANGKEHAYFLNGVVPEPTTWALMIAGFCAAGVMLRRRRAEMAA